MMCLLFSAEILSLVHIIFSSAERVDFLKVPDDAADGEKFFKNVVNGEELKERPEYLLFTAPFKICKGGCKNSNISNFNMLFPLYIGQKKIQTVYQNMYYRDHQSIHSKADRAPFRKATTRVPFTICPTCSYDSKEGRAKPSMRPNCKVKHKKVDFEETYAFKTPNLRTRKDLVQKYQNDKVRTVKYFLNSNQQPKENIYRTFWPFWSNKY